MSNKPESTFGDRVLEIIAVLLLGITTVGTAWCGYQASQWNGEQGDFARAASDQRVEGSRLFGVASQRVAYDASVIGQYAQAVQAGNDGLAEFYIKTLVRPDFVPLLKEWQAQVQAGGTPTSLFEDKAYLDSQFGGYQAASDQAEQDDLLSRAAGDNADAYVITTILLAVALFFAGVTGSFRYRPARVILLFLAVGTIAFAATRLADLPIA